MNKPVLSKDEALPLYAQLKNILLDQITSGELKSGDKILSELRLSDTYGVSRMTVRQAVLELVKQGYLVRDQGRGTFVSIPKITQHLSSLTGFTEDMAVRGKQVSSMVLKQRIVDLDDIHERINFISKKLKEPTIQLERIRLADYDVFALENCFLRFQGCEKLLNYDFSNQSLYDVLVSDFGIIPTKAYQEIEAGLVDGDRAKLLGVKKSSPVLKTFRRTFDQNDDDFEYIRSLYRSDKFVFRAELTIPR